MNLILTRAKKVTSQLFLLRPQLDYVQIASLQFYTISYTKCVTRDDNLQYVVLQGILLPLQNKFIWFTSVPFSLMIHAVVCRLIQSF